LVEYQVITESRTSWLTPRSLLPLCYVLENSRWEECNSIKGSSYDLSIILIRKRVYLFKHP